MTRERVICGQKIKMKGSFSVAALNEGGIALPGRWAATRHLETPVERPQRIGCNRAQGFYLEGWCRSQMQRCRQRRVHRHANRAMVFLWRLIMMRTLLERSGLSMSVAGLRRTHEGDHQDAKRSDHPHPNHWLLGVLSALKITLHDVLRFYLCSTS